MVKNVIFIVVVTIALGCHSHKAQNSVCRLKDIKTLYSDPNMHVGVDTAYGYTVLIKDFSRECMDSSTMVNIALKYIDTVKGGKPVNGVAFYSSDKDFIPNEHSQIMEEIDKSCLFKITFNEKTCQPDNFVFYNDKGETIYWGSKWKKDGDKESNWHK